MKRFEAILLAAVVLAGVTGCTSTSTSESTTTVSVTDENGVTTTETTTTKTDENGVTTVEKTVTDENGNVVNVTEEADENGEAAAESGTSDSGETEVRNEVAETVEDLDEELVEAETDESDAERREVWESSFTSGAEGSNENGDRCFIAFDSLEDFTFGAVLFLPADGTDPIFLIGSVESDGETTSLIDMETEDVLEFTYGDGSLPGSDFSIIYADGDTYDMQYVDKSVIIDDMMSYV